MKRPENIRKLLAKRILRLLMGVMLCVLAFESLLLSQDPPQAPKTDSEPRPLKAPKPVEELESVDPHSAAIPKSWFEDVPVNPTGILIQSDDVPAYLRILEHVRGVPPENLANADGEFRLEMIEKFGERTQEKISREIKDQTQKKRVLKQLADRQRKYREDPATYPLVRDAFNHASECQGEVMSFSGHVRRVLSFPAGENEYGFDQLYEVWLFDEESNGYPVIVVCSELPQDFPIDFPETESIDGVSVRGYFFKLYAYEGGEQYHAIPMILAKTVEWDPPQSGARKLPEWIYGIAIAVGIIALWLIIRSNRPNKRLRSVREKLSEPEDNPFQQPE